MVDLSGKLAVVSGGARDIGRAVCLTFAECGADVAFCYRESADAARTTAEDIRKRGRKALAASADVTQNAQIETFVAQVQKEFARPIDILVNVAGGLIARKKMEEMDEAFWKQVMDVNLTSTFLVTKAVLPHMKEGGAIVNFSSQAARDGGGPGAIAYATAKGAIVTFTRGLCKELGPRRIRANAVCAGMTRTTFHDTFTKPEVRKAVAAAMPIGREGEAHEVAALVAFLASSDGAMINGACVDINGGIVFS